MSLPDIFSLPDINSLPDIHQKKVISNFDIDITEAIYEQKEISDDNSEGKCEEEKPALIKDEQETV